MLKKVTKRVAIFFFILYGAKTLIDAAKKNKSNLQQLKTI